MGSRGTEQTSVPRIGHVEIHAYDVFGGEEEEEPDFWAFRTANRLHIRTREDIIRQELLFEAGDPYQEEAVAQTERNLRALRFLRDARIDTHVLEDGTIRIDVHTWDAWSTIPQLRLAKVGNEWVWALGAAESNLFGRGKQIEVTRRQDIERRENYFSYRDPRIAGSRVGLGTSYSNRSDGERAFVGIGRPFFSLWTDWAFGAELEGFDQLDRIYRDGREVRRLRHVRRRADFEWARALRHSEQHALRLHLAYRKIEDEVEEDVRNFGIVQVGFTFLQHQFLELTHVNRFERHEDFNLGYQVGAFLGASTAAFGGESGTSWFWLLRARKGFKLGGEHFLIGTVSWQARHRRGGLENSLAGYRVVYVNKLAPRHLVIASARMLVGRNLDPEVQITMGADTGLRGYPVRQFTGNRSLHLSAEKRFFIADEVWRLASLGVGAFVDSGFAWPEGKSIDLGDLRSNLGIGLLVGKNRVNPVSPTARFDLAYALHPIAGRSRWLFSAGSQIGF